LTALEDITGGKAKKLVCTLHVTGGPKINTFKTAFSHVVGNIGIMVDGAVAAKRGLTMFLEAELPPEDEFTRRVLLGNTLARREGIHHHDGVVDEGCDDGVGKYGEWKTGNDTTASVLSRVML